MIINLHARKIETKLRVAIYAMTEFAMSKLVPSTRLRNNITINLHLKHHSEDGEAMISEFTNPNKPRAFLDEYLPVINLTAQTPVVHICFGSSIIEKLHSLAVGFLDKDRLVDFKQKGRGLKISMADTALDMGALKDIYNKNK